MSRERNPEIRPNRELPLFEQSFYKFEQQRSLDGSTCQPVNRQVAPALGVRVPSHPEAKSTPRPVEQIDASAERSVKSCSSDVAHARRSDPQTSHKAAASVVNLGRTREAIIAILRVHPLTDEQLWEQYKLGMDAGITDFPRRTQSGLRSRRAELVTLGFVEACGTGKTASGRECQGWRLK